MPQMAVVEKGQDAQLKTHRGSSKTEALENKRTTQQWRWTTGRTNESVDICKRTELTP